MKRIIITGGMGYIGTVLIEQLLNFNYDLVIIDSLLHGQVVNDEFINHKKIKIICADLRNFSEYESELINAYCIIHLAAIVGDPASKLNSSETLSVNIDSSIKIFELAIKYNIKKFIFSSTCSNYGKMQDQSLLDEDSKLNPLSIYASSKVQFEEYLKGIASNTRIDTTILRFATAHGMSKRPRFDLTINEFVLALHSNLELEVFGKQFFRPYCHVIDLAKAVILALENNSNTLNPKIYNVGSNSENYNKEQIIAILNEYYPKAKIKYVHLKDDPRDYRVDFSKIKSELGFDPKLDINFGISEVKTALESGEIIDPFSKTHRNS